MNNDKWAICGFLYTDEEAKAELSNYKDYKSTGREWEVEV